MDVVIKLVSLVITHDVTPSIVMILFFVHQQNKQSNQNKKEIEKLKKYNEKQQAEEKEHRSKELEKLKTYNEKRQAEELEKLKTYNEKRQAEEKEYQSIKLENVLERIKNHDRDNQKHVEKLLLELINKEK